MPAYVALLRAVNVGGTGKLPMPAFVQLCEATGLESVRTYIASGNAVFTSRLKERRIKALLEQRLAAYAGKSVGVLVRTADALEAVRGRKDELLALGAREIYVAYGDRMADSRLAIPAAGTGTARNMNTVAKLAAMAREV
ncbi:MAG TPA: DUF1697 domain-containing protein [Steroidobacteraceae bacterium]|jgi:uncharacterized protein (DUF1697 family)|nr:DUF1697 domain-containing protein [Steroidobacteraceae bacterium]